MYNSPANFSAKEKRSKIARVLTQQTNRLYCNIQLGFWQELCTSSRLFRQFMAGPILHVKRKARYCSTKPSAKRGATAKRRARSCSLALLAERDGVGTF